MNMDDNKDMNMNDSKDNNMNDSKDMNMNDMDTVMVIHSIYMEHNFK